MTDPVAFLRARLDEDEAAAKAVRAEAWREALAGGWNEWDEQEHAHAARHNPARVLADVEAKRRIIREATYWSVDARPISPNARQFAGDTLRLLALPYADHPEFDESWRP